jgi:hypothetical protein
MWPASLLAFKLCRDAPNITSICEIKLTRDRILSLQFGRPAMIDNPSSKQVPLPMAVDDQFLESGQPADQPAILAFYVHTLGIFEILSRAQKISALIEDEHLEQKDQYRLLFGDSDLANVTSVLEIDQALTNWYRQLPHHLQLRSTASDNMSTVMRQAHITRFRYLHCRILIFRPVLSRFCLAQNELSSSITKFDDSLPQRMALSCSTLCLRAAHETIEIIQNNMDSQAIMGHIPLWWNAILYVYTSATVLQAARLHPVVETSVGDYSTETSWRHAIGVLKRLGRFGSTAQRSLVALEILADKITEATAAQGKIETGPGSAGGLPTPAPSTWTNPSTGPTPAPMPTRADAGDLEADGLQFPGLDDPFDLAEFDFDLNDMSWLTSAPVDL